MTIDLADHIDGTPGRFVPQEMRGELVEAEHMSRYWWAAGLADGRRVLDAGCGVGYGSVLMAGAGATEVTGVDLAEDVVHAARADAVDGVRFQAADVRALPFRDGAFDLVVCFEVIEHVEEQGRVLDELHRVLAPGGVLAISSPNRDVYVPGNPHHHHELTPGELDAALTARWPSVRLFQQHNYVASTIVAAGDDGPGGSEVRFLAPEPMGGETYTLALASDGTLVEPRLLVTLAAPVEIRRWLERFDSQQAILERQADALSGVVQERDRRLEAQRALVDAETALSQVPALRERLAVAESAYAELAAEQQRAHQAAEHAERVLSDVTRSLSWRLTAPLRGAKRLLK